MMKVLKAATLYFVLVFGAGFVLGPIRILWLVPQVGTRLAELMEMPVMLVVIVSAARWITRRLVVPAAPSARLGMGLLALALLLAAELALELWFQGRSVGDYLANRDPVSGVVYAAMLGVFAAVPLLVGRK